MKEIEYHPLEPFLPADAKLLMLGSFPPKENRWSMNFFYPNFQNDMWRILGLIFFEDKKYFTIEEQKSFDQEAIKEFLDKEGIAVYDVARAIIRHKDNASDNFLEIVEKTDLSKILEQIPNCVAIATTGEKATKVLCELFNCREPRIGDLVEIIFNGRCIKFYRMPSSSRAYPLAVEKKSEKYASMFKELRML